MDNNDEIIQKLIQRVYHLEQEVIKLGGTPYNAQCEVQPAKESYNAQHEVQPVEELYSTQTEVQPTKESFTDHISTEESTIEVQNPQIQSSESEIHRTETKKQPKESQKQNIENRIGKNLMGILASVLIFFSLILFAGIAFNYISDTAKVIIMFAISICIAAVGIVKMPKKNSEKESKYKTFFTTLAACGIGAIYITDLVAYFGFHCIPLIPFIISLVIWILITMFLAFKCSNIFVYICNIGLIIATFLTAIQFENSLLGFILYTVCLIALYFMNRHDDFNKDCFYFIQYPIVFLILTIAVDTSVFNFVIFTVLLSIIFVIANVLYDISISQLPTNIVTAFLNIIALIRICVGVKNDTMSIVVIFLLIAIMALYFVKHYRTNHVLFYVIYFATYFISVCIFLTTDLYILIALTPFILFILAGFILKDRVVRIGGYIAFLLSFMIHLNFYETWFVVAAYLLVYAVTSVTVGLIQYTIVDKYILTAILFISLIDVINTFNINVCVSFALFGVVAMFMNLRPYAVNPKTKVKELSSEIVGYVICAIMIIVGLAHMFSEALTSETYQVIIISLITLVLCLINTQKIYKSGIPEMLVGFYLCIKFSLWIYAVLFRLEAASFVVSIVGILIAITCIVLGFGVKQKAFRLYGLILSMVSVIKLILFDISYDSNILRPVGFFVAGVLCFAISFIYSRIEKSITD